MFCATAVAAGAFGTHALRSAVSAADLEVWRTASQYLLLHGVALFAFGISERDALKLPACLIVFGSIVFSGSLFALVLGDLRWLGAVTPVGGASMIIGWLLAAAAVARGTIRR